MPVNIKMKYNFFRYGFYVLTGLVFCGKGIGEGEYREEEDEEGEEGQRKR